MKITPTVGRVVWFRSSVRKELEPLAAIVAKVNEDETVNLGVFTVFGNLHGYENVLLVQEGEPKPDDQDYCEWMPWQIGQANKTILEQIADGAK